MLYLSNARKLVRKKTPSAGKGSSNASVDDQIHPLDNQHLSAKSASSIATELQPTLPLTETTDRLVHQATEHIAAAQPHDGTASNVQPGDSNQVEAAEVEPSTAVVPESTVAKRLATVADVTSGQRLADNPLLGIMIHETNRLKTNVFIAHPLVQVHIIDTDSGQYLKKTDRAKPVAYNSDVAVDHILPLMTQKCELEKKHDQSPHWNELLLFNEPFEYFEKASQRLLFVFEVLDFISMAAASHRYKQLKEIGGWHRIAWAFYKPVLKEDNLHSNQRLQLQLYKAPKRRKASGKFVEHSQRVLYPSSLHITFKKVVPPKHIEAAMRSMFALQQEAMPNSEHEQQTTSIEANNGLGTGSDAESRPKLHTEEISPWIRLSGQRCKVPNRSTSALPGGKLGCSRLAFSPNGRLLACACAESDVHFPIKIYEVLTSHLRSTLSGHTGIVYDLTWAGDDVTLLSASGDTTARLWDLTSITCVQVFPHPTFVYCCAYCMVRPGYVITGAFDGCVRLWHRTEGIVGQMVRCLEMLPSYCSSLTINAARSTLFVSSKGILSLWKMPPDDTMDFMGEWSRVKHIKDDHFKDEVIAQVFVHPDGRRVILLSKAGRVHIVDCRRWAVVHTWSVLAEQEYGDDCCVIGALTCCGTFLFTIACDDSHRCCVWLLDAGGMVAEYNMSGEGHLAAIALHPLDDIVVWAVYGDNQPISVYRHDNQTPPLYEEQNAPAIAQVQRRPVVDLTDFSAEKLLQEHRLLRSNFHPISTAVALREKGQITDELQPIKDVGRASLMEPVAAVVQDDLKEQRKPSKEQEPLPMQIVKAIYTYKPQGPDEISFSKGQHIQVLTQDDPDWWIGKVLPDGTPGYFPSNYVKKSGLKNSDAVTIHS